MIGNFRIYNSRSGRKETFKPQEKKQVRIFVCGPTVDGFAHIGHARTYVVFDCLAKYLSHLGYKVFYLQNITDVDDKIIAKAKEKGVVPKDLASAFEKEHLADMKSLGIDSVTEYARATDYIPQIISQVERLVSKGYAYQLDDGIYFDIGKFKRYGKLSGRTALQAEDAVSRIDYHTQKKNRGDFCLWKFSNSQVQGEPSWPSPFGQGRPGWHIEDTAITESFFGAQYDIHGGGRDLLFPHHEAEVAQMEAISGKRPLAHYWMHTGFLTIEGQKMSKSLGNSVWVSEFLKRYTSQQMRFWIVKHLWRAPMNYSESMMIEVRSALEKMEEFLRKIKNQTCPHRLCRRRCRRESNIKTTNQKFKNILQKTKEDFYKSLADDFNTPKAFATLFEFIKQINIAIGQKPLGKNDASNIFEFFEEMNAIFNIIDFGKLAHDNVPLEVKKLVNEREKFRKQSDWSKADELRLEIEKYGYTVDDTTAKPVIKRLS